MSTQPVILIYNPISGRGHLDSWNALFVALLLERGWRVLALTQDPRALVSRLEHKGLAQNRDFQLLEWMADSPRPVSYLKTLWERWVRFGDMYFYRRAGSETSPDLPFGEYWKRRVCQVVVPFPFRLSHYLYRRYRRLRSRGIKASPLQRQEIDRDCPADMSRRVSAALKKAKWSPAVAFNMYMDTYTTDQSRWDEFAGANRLRWAGIRFVPPPAPDDPCYRVPLWQGMCVLDEGVCRAYSESLPEKHFEYLPDITETALPERPAAIVEEILRRADGRKIVFLGGSIGGQKNLARWYELIELADSRDWFFVQIGEIHRTTLTAEDLALLDKALATPPENLLVYAGYVADEKVFNKIIDICDVIFAVYRDFRISSNMLGKAAHFRKPILVSDRYLLGERVMRYGIGHTVDEDDAASILSGLLKTANNPLPAEGFSRYSSEFSIDALALRLENFFYKCSK